MSGLCQLDDCVYPTLPDEGDMAHVYCPAHAEEYRTSGEEQLKSWVDGICVHNQRFNECCPDFSCCRPELLAQAELRRAFQSADAEGRDSMLWDFLGALAGTPAAN